jgi:hypothetical protein
MVNNYLSCLLPWLFAIIWANSHLAALVKSTASSKYYYIYIYLLSLFTYLLTTITTTITYLMFITLSLSLPFFLISFVSFHSYDI